MLLRVGGKLVNPFPDNIRLQVSRIARVDMGNELGNKARMEVDHVLSMCARHARSLNLM